MSRFSPDIPVSDTTVDVSIIVPALNEAENLPELLRRLSAVLTGRSYDVWIVDDNSRDNTPQVCAELANTYPLHLVVRKNPKNGLSGAVLHGMAAAAGKCFLVMDADLQHPPEQVPALLADLERGADFVLGSRYTPGGSTEAEWGLFRKINSRAATFLARPFAGRTTDPMSGFFALRRSTYENAERLTPLGYKVGLELMCKCRVRNVREVPIHFANRTRGESKLNLKQQFKYLEHLSRLYDFFFPRASPIAKFLIVTAASWLVGLAFYLQLRAFLNPIAATTLGYLANILMTALFHRRYVRTQAEFLLTRHPWVEFSLIAAAEVVTCFITAIWAMHRLRHPTSPELALLAFGCATAVRYVLRKELLQDIRGLRPSLRSIEIVNPDSPARTT